jgi:hypothetical protein
MTRCKHLCLIYALTKHAFRKRAEVSIGCTGYGERVMMTQDHSEAIVPFNWQEKRSERAVVESFHRIITLSLERFNAWLRPLLPRSRKSAVSSIQDHDPYLESLLRALHWSQMRDQGSTTG